MRARWPGDADLTAFATMGLEEGVKSPIATKCGGDKAPERLRQRPMQEISPTAVIRD